LGEGAFLGSNNWVISGDHTATGLPLLANDPHLGIQMPAIWYEVGLHAPGWDVSGFSFAGVPTVIIGHNDRIAWGVTNVGPDVQDLYIEKINPSDPNQYEYDGRWREMEIVEEIIKVNGGEDVILQVRLTRHGPIINELVEGTSDALAFRWTVQDQNRIFQAVVLLNQARDFDDFQEALSYWDVPSQNVVYADVEGNIGYQMPGLVPVRTNGDGRVPVPGWTDEYDWDGWIPYEELPALYNPSRGYIVTANNAVVDPAYPHFIASAWDFGDRAQRISELIEASINAGAVTADNMATIQFDDKSLFAQQYLPLLNGLSSDDTQVQAALERLRGWDMHEHVESVPAAIFEIFFMKLAYAVLADDVGEENVDRVTNGTFMHQLADQPEAQWWDDTGTAEVETRDQIILRALSDAVEWLEEQLGADMNDWQWGELHTATFVSDPLGQSGIGVIESLVNRGPFPSNGGRTLVNNTAWGWDNPAAITSHPSMRMIVDLSDFDASRAVLPTGQSGHPGHRHYDDMIDLWLAGDFHPWPFGRAAVEAAAMDRLVLAPPEAE
jgi:penicillin amidase